MTPKDVTAHPPAISKLELVLLAIVVLVAAWLRFQHLDQAEFLWDQAEISKWALNVGQQRQITWIGPISSTRLDTFPGAIWLLAIPYAISTSPVFATGFIAAINLSVVVACYFIARRWFGRTAAMVATLLFAVAPWAVVYSRKIWHTELLPPFTPFYVVTGWYAFVRGRRWAVLAHCLALAALLQIHFAALAFIPLTVLWALIFCRRLEWRMVPLGALLAILTFAPYFVIDAQKDWRNIRLFAEIMQQPALVSTDAAHYTWVITTGLDLHWLTGPDRYPDFVAATPNVRWLFAVVGGLAATGGVVALWRAVRQARAGLDDETAAALMTVTWLTMPALFLTRSSTGVAPHYFTTTFPAQFFLVGWLVSLVWRRSGRIARTVRGVLVALILALAAAQIYETTSLLQFVMTHDTRWGYGTPIAYETQAVQTATRLGQEIGGAEVILLSEGDDPRMFEMPAVADVLMYDSDIPHRSVDIRTALVLPSSPAVYWSTYDVTSGEELLATFTPELVEARIPLREGARAFRFYRWPGGEPTIPNAQSLPGGPRTWANGAQLIGYQLAGDLCPGGTIHWTLIWRATQTPTGDVYYHWFNHLLDEQDQIRGQRDGPSLLPAYWRAGDTILNWFDLQIPPDAPAGDYTMRVGMYAYPTVEMENVPLLDAGDAPAGDWVEIGPLLVEE
ncbi:MAG: glycosyltransferase family 39 protein [Chloroflexota bacterium]|nr:glycosyltransferase family 39 protein [Chloroflexota bacterium]